MEVIHPLYLKIHTSGEYLVFTPHGKRFRFQFPIAALEKHSVVGNYKGTLWSFNIGELVKSVHFPDCLQADMQGAVQEINEKHLAPWAEACQKDAIANTPLSPYLSQELLYDKNLCMDGSKLQSIGFTYRVPEINKDCINEIIDDYIQMNIFPKSLIK